MNDDLDRLDRRVRLATRDAQCRDWSAERADRVGFARLAVVHWEIEWARGSASGPLEPGWLLGTALGAMVLTPTLILVLADHAAAPLTLALALFAGSVAVYLVFAVTRVVRGWRARRATSGPAEIDNPYLYAELTRALESARAENPSAERAQSIERAMLFVDSARDELAGRSLAD